MKRPLTKNFKLRWNHKKNDRTSDVKLMGGFRLTFETKEEASAFLTQQFGEMATNFSILPTEAGD